MREGTHERWNCGGRIGELERLFRRLELALHDRQMLLSSHLRHPAQRSINPRERRVDAVEEISFFRGRINHGCQALVVRDRRSHLRNEAASILRSLETETEPRECL